MPDCQITELITEPQQPEAGKPCHVAISFAIEPALVPDLQFEVNWVNQQTGEIDHRSDSAEAGMDIAWLPRGSFRIDWLCPQLNLSSGDYRLHINVFRKRLSEQMLAAQLAIDVSVSGEHDSAGITPSWQLKSLTEGIDVDTLAWKQGDSNWFYRHFDHACRVIVDYMLGGSDLLKGHILDVGCGDGITDLGVFHRCQPKSLIGVDPFCGYKRLPEICRDHQIELGDLPNGLSFMDASGNKLPFEDDSFDVVLSWGSLEHIAGGYRETLLEIKRVLRDGGLFFVHPGLYYSNIGHHLGEFSDEPFFHLTRSDQEVKEMVLGTTPDYMDRAGEFASPEQYWQWYKELNPIRVDEFEMQLKELGFEFYRASLRVAHQIEYVHPRMQQYRMQDMATDELYLSAFNRK